MATIVAMAFFFFLLLSMSYEFSCTLHNFRFLASVPAPQQHSGRNWL
jgi:hypothetical protein